MDVTQTGRILGRGCMVHGHISQTRVLGRCDAISIIVNVAAVGGTWAANLTREKRQMIKKISILIVSVLIAFSLGAVETFLTFENDVFGNFGDNDYSHGTCFEIVEQTWHFKVGQNMYTPSNLKRSDHIVGDRPYAGILYGGIGKELTFQKDSMFTHYLELDFGMIGPSARCEQTQKFIHKILDCRKPMGWKHQLHDEFVVNAQWWTKYNWYICDYIALVPRAGTLVGTVQDAIEVGCDLKIGWNLRNDIGNQILFSASKDRSFLDDLSIWGFVGCDERYYLYNHFFEGSLFNNKDKDLKVDIEPFVFEWRCGAALQYRNFYICYYLIFREDEFKHQKNKPNYGGLCIGWSF